MAENVQINLNARNNAGPAIKQVQTELNGLGKAGNSASQGLSSLGGALAGGALFGAAIAGVQALGGAIVDMAAGAAKLETLRNSFDGLASGVGQSSAAMLDALRQTSAGMISDQDLLLAANKAMLLGVADTADEMTSLMQIAMQRGAAMGLSTTQAFNDIVTGLGRGSALILDNLGIVVDAEANNEAYAASIGKVASALTEQEKKQALINAVMREASGGAADATSSLSEQARAIGSMGAAWQNLKDQLGTLVSPAVATAMQGLANALNQINTAIDAQPQTREDIAAAQADDMRTRIAALEEQGRAEMAAAAAARAAAEQTADTRDYAKEAMLGQMAAAELMMGAEQELYAQEIAGAQATTAAYRVYQAELERTGSASMALAAQKRFELQAFIETNGVVESAVAAYREGERAAYVLAGAEQDVGNAAATAAPQVHTLTYAMQQQVAAAQGAAAGVRQLISSVEGFFLGMAGEMGGFAAGTAATELQTELNRERERMTRQGYDERTIQFQLAELYQDRTRQIQEQVRAQDSATAAVGRYGGAAVSAYDDAAAAAQREFDALTSKVQSVLSLDAGVDAAGLLPREDAVNENARRLADIAVNGFKDQDWLGAFAESVPDIFKALSESSDPKGAAAAMLRDFQDGLVPDLLDKDRAKELVKRMITGEQTMAALAQEIAGELSQELGVALPQAQAAAFGALGVKTDAATGVSDGAAAELSNEKTLQGMAKAGVEAATTWGAAFLDKVAQGVPGELIAMLTTLITPQVQANLAAAQSQAAAQ